MEAEHEFKHQTVNIRAVLAEVTVAPTSFPFLPLSPFPFRPFLHPFFPFFSSPSVIFHQMFLLCSVLTSLIPVYLYFHNLFSFPVLSFLLSTLMFSTTAIVLLQTPFHPSFLFISLSLHYLSLETVLKFGKPNPKQMFCMLCFYSPHFPVSQCCDSSSCFYQPVPLLLCLCESLSNGARNGAKNTKTIETTCGLYRITAPMIISCRD